MLTVRKEVREVNLILTVTDHRRRLVQDLAQDDFRILDNGLSPDRITYFESRARLPLRLALVIDVSDSVQCYFGIEKQAARMFLKHVLRSKSDLAVVIGFNQKVWVAQGPTGDHRLISQGIKHLRGGGSTSVFDAVALASEELARVHDTGPSRRAIILITDGDDNASKMTLQESEQISQQNESIVYVLDISADYERLNQPEQAMKDLSAMTGGQLLRAADEFGINRAFEKIESELRSQYVIGYKPQNAFPDGSFHQIAVSVSKNLTVHCRHGYVAR